MNQSIDKTRKTTLPSRKKSAEELLVSLGRALAECDAAIKRRDALVCERPAESLDPSIPHFPCCHWTVDVTIHDDGTREEHFAFTGGGTMLKKPFRSLAEVPALKPDNPADFARWCPSCQKRPAIALEIRALKRKVGAARSVLTKRARVMAADKLKLVYIAGPFRGPTPGDVARNIERAEAAARFAVTLGVFPVTPHSIGARLQGVGSQESFWLPGTLELMRRCDEIWVVPNFEQSKGTRNEIDEARRLGIQIVYLTEEDLL